MALFTLVTLAEIVLSLISLLFLFGCLYLIYIHHKYSHLPGPPRSSFFFGHVLAIGEYFKQGKTAYDYFLDMNEKFGPIFLVFNVYRPVVFIGDPVYIKEVFIDNHARVPKIDAVYGKIGYFYGERALGHGLVTNTNVSSWIRRRQVIGLAFHRQQLKNVMPVFNKVCDQLFQRLASFVSQNTEVAMLRELGNATLDVIAQAAFGIDLKATRDATSPFREEFGHILQGIEDNYRMPFPAWVLKIYQCTLFQSDIQQRQFKAAKFVREFARKRISERFSAMERGEDTPDDVLSYILRCVEKDDTMTMDDLIDEFITIFFAGHETTASSLAFTLLEVISNSEIEENILKEVEEVVGPKEHVDFEDLPKLKYVGQCVMEGLRKFMIAGGPSRILKKDIVVGNYNIPAGCTVVANKYGMNRSSVFWKNPEVYDPSRFANPENIPNFRYLYFPFSVGPRNCVGQNFALLEAKVFLARLIRKFKFRLVPGQTSNIDERLTLTPKDGVICTAEFR